MEDLEEVGGAPYKVLLTMVPWYERLHCPGRVELEGAGVPLFERQIQERKAFRHAANEGLPVYGVRRRGRRAVGRSTRRWAGSCSERWRWRDERGGDRRNRGEGAMAGALARRSSSRAAPAAGTVSGVERTSGPVPVRRGARGRGSGRARTQRTSWGRPTCWNRSTTRSWLSSSGPM